MSSPINSMIDKVVKPVPKPDNIADGVKYPTHEGLLIISDVELKVYVLNTGERIIDA